MKKFEFTIKKSSLFIKQVNFSILYYKENAGLRIADRFIDSIESALQFIQENPYSCAVYQFEHIGNLHKFQFRKCNLEGFPHSIFFHMPGNQVITIDAIYAHKMNISSRLA